MEEEQDRRLRSNYCVEIRAKTKKNWLWILFHLHSFPSPTHPPKKTKTKQQQQKRSVLVPKVEDCLKGQILTLLELNGNKSKQPHAEMVFRSGFWSQIKTGLILILAYPEESMFITFGKSVCLRRYSCSLHAQDLQRNPRSPQDSFRFHVKLKSELVKRFPKKSGHMRAQNGIKLG